MGSTNSGLKGLAATNVSQQGPEHQDSKFQPSTGPDWKVQGPYQALQPLSAGKSEDFSRSTGKNIYHLPRAWRSKVAQSRDCEVGSSDERQVTLSTF